MTIRRIGLAVVITALVAGVLALYYVVHKPITPAQALAIAQTCANVAVALILAFAAGGVGHRLLRVVFGAGADPNAAGDATIVAVTLGLGTLALAMLLLGALRLYYPIVVWLLSVGLCLWLRRDIHQWAAMLVETARTVVPGSRVERLAAGFT